jgi:hypothetical protein
VTLYPQLRTCTRRRRVWRTWAQCTYYCRSMVGLGRDTHVRRCCLRAVCLAIATTNGPGTWSSMRVGENSVCIRTGGRTRTPACT